MSAQPTSAVNSPATPAGGGERQEGVRNVGGAGTAASAGGAGPLPLLAGGRAVAARCPGRRPGYHHGAPGARLRCIIFYRSREQFVSQQVQEQSYS